MGFPFVYNDRYVNAVCFLFVLEILEAHDFYYFWMPRNYTSVEGQYWRGGTPTLLPTFHCSSYLSSSNRK